MAAADSCRTLAAGFSPTARGSRARTIISSRIVVCGTVSRWPSRRASNSRALVDSLPPRVLRTVCVRRCRISPFPSRRDSQYAVSLRQWRIAEHCELGFVVAR